MQPLAANALYRVAQLGPQDRPTLLKNLDAAIRAYADALRAGRTGRTSAFNYELAMRMRAEISGGKRKIIANPKADNTKSEPNMHGDPGEPPKDMKVEQFQIRIPMDPQEIKTQSGDGGNRTPAETAGLVCTASSGLPRFALASRSFCGCCSRRGCCSASGAGGCSARVDARRYRAARLIPLKERFARRSVSSRSGSR